ncbi:HalOD1 output domain-containing protein [Halegenticoccus soli]|uniref:HalOD1 output domain-containing protein n=1 Tax=Halegenticoccus soli TaxID=1985678 RepID=UPI00117B5BE0|nr:HalOD1 output domain-containing protein [Halegenticoccus soli]
MSKHGRVVYEPSPVERISDGVLVAVSRREGCDQMELQLPLSEAINPDALDDLFTTIEDPHPRPDVFVSFPYDGCSVTVRSNRSGTVRISVGERSEREALSD